MPQNNFETIETQAQTFTEAAENTKRYEDIARSVAERVKNVTPENKELVLHKMDKFFEENRIEGYDLFQALQKFEGGNSILCAQMNSDEIKYGFGLYLQEMSKLPDVDKTQLLEQTAEVLKLAKIYREMEDDLKNRDYPRGDLRLQIIQNSSDPRALLAKPDTPLEWLHDYKDVYVDIKRTWIYNTDTKATTLLTLVNE